MIKVNGIAFTGEQEKIVRVLINRLSAREHALALRDESIAARDDRIAVAEETIGVLRDALAAHQATSRLHAAEGQVLLNELGRVGD